MASIFTSFCVFSVFCVFALLFAESNGFTLDLIHPNSPLNPFRHPSQSRFDYIRQAFRHSQSRAAYINGRINGDVSTKFKTIVKPAPGGYVMKYSIGTPPFETYGIADTGSDITWTQCKPCTDCFKQDLPMFDPKDSSSYKTVSCDSSTCSSGGRSFSCGDGGNCQYEVTYGDQSSTVGDVAIDTLTLGNTSFKNVLFGCGHQNGGTFNEETPGIVGLGGDGATSIIALLDKQIGGKFAYCLSPEANTTSHISFGPDAVVKGGKAVSTPLTKKLSQPTFYWLNLERISVGGRSLNVKSPAAGISGRRAGRVKQAGGEGNIIIDSGTKLTYLPADLYTDFESAVRDAISGIPVSDPQGLFPLCYASTGDLEVPRIVAHFTGADVELSPKGTFVEVEEGMVCLSIIPDTSLNIAIFGNLSEIDYIVGYDLVAGTVTFKSADCSKY